MVSRYDQLCPVFFGNGALQKLPEAAQDLKIKKAIIVCDNGIVNSGICDRTADYLKSGGIDVVVYKGVMMDAPASCVIEGAGIAYENHVDGVVGLGGGSCLDAAKGISILAANMHIPLKEMLCGTSPEYHPLPKIMVPTTAGTGSECTIFAVISDTDSARKRSLFTSPDAAVVDPMLTVGLSPDITAYTGMDAFSHSVEAYTSIRPNPHSDLLSLNAIRRISTWLPSAYKYPNWLEARENMALASNFAGIAFSNSATHIGHAMAHAIGATYHVPHGIACSWVMPGVLNVLAKYLPQKVADICSAMGYSLASSALSTEKLGQYASDAVCGLMRKINIPDCSAYGLKETDLEKCGEYACGEKLRSLCGAPVTDEEIHQILVCVPQIYY